VSSELGFTPVIVRQIYSTQSIAVTEHEIRSVCKVLQRLAITPPSLKNVG